MMSDQETIVEGFFSIQMMGGCVTLPRQVQRILQAKHGYHAVNVNSQSFAFLDGVEFDECRSFICGDGDLTFLGARFPVHRDLDRPRLLFATSDRPEAEGLTLTVIGADGAGNKLRRVVAGEPTTNGLQVPIVATDCTTPPQFNCGDGIHRGEVGGIEMIRKPRTNGYVQLWGLDELHGDVYWLTTMAPDEESPSLVRYRYNGSNCPHTLFVEATLQWVPLYDLNEISLIQSPDAFEDYAQACAFKDAGNVGQYSFFKNSALKRVREVRRREAGTNHKMRVGINKMPLRGQNFSMRRYY